MGTALTASVWGKGKQAQMTSRPLRPGEEECCLCRNDVPALVRLKGCQCSNYAVCLACVENLRAHNIFRANKGVTCPFCRGYIESFEPASRDDPDSAQLEELLTEANRAARVAAAARAGIPVANKPEGSQALARTDWGCKSCGNSNAWWSPRCSECDQPGPSPAPAKPATWGVTEDVRQQIQVLRHPTMQKAFTEIAVPITQQNQVGEFDESQMMKRLRDYPKGADKLLNLVKALSDPAFFKECSTHIAGNFTVQNLIEVLARIRNNLSNTQKSWAIENFKRFSRGLDPFSQLLYTMLPMATELAVHTQGTYVTQKLIFYVNSQQELFDVCRAVLPDTVLLLQDEKGKFAVKKTIEVLEELHACSPSSHPVVAKGINFAAKAFLPQFNKAMFAAGNHFGASTLSGVVCMGIPCFESFDLGSRLATKARQLLTKGYHGLSVLSRIINSKGGPGSLEWYSEHMRDLLCIVTMQLLDMLPMLVMSEKTEETKLVKDLVLRLAEEQEVLWIEEIIGELVNRGDELALKADAVDVLITALSVDLLTDDDVHLQLLQLRELIGQAVYAIADEIEAMRGPDVQMPPLRYHMPSAIQPEMRWWLMAGNKIPPPPPPPPGRPPLRSANPSFSTTPAPAPPKPVSTVATPTPAAAPAPAPARTPPSGVVSPGAVSRPGGPPPGFPPMPMPVPMPLPVPTSVPSTAPPQQPLQQQQQQQQQQVWPTASPTPAMTAPGSAAMPPIVSRPVISAPLSLAPPPSQPALVTPVSMQHQSRTSITPSTSNGALPKPSYPPPPPPITSMSHAFQQLALSQHQNAQQRRQQQQQFQQYPMASTAVRVPPAPLPNSRPAPPPPPPAPAPSPAYNTKLLPYAIPVGAPQPAPGLAPPPAPTSNGSSWGSSSFVQGPPTAVPAPVPPSYQPFLPFAAAPRSSSVSQPPQVPMAARAAPPTRPPAQPWGCKVCTYMHEGAEAEFLSCALCGTLNE